MGAGMRGGGHADRDRGVAGDMAMRLIHWLRRRGINLWIIAALVGANLYLWTGTLLAAQAPYVVAPLRAPQVVELLDRISSGQHAGETWEVALTDREAEQTITWYLERYPEIP